MHLNVFLLIFVLHGASSLKKLMKPSFIPYCTTRDKCQPACSCEILPRCEVLPMDNTTRETILFYHNQIRDIQSRAEPEPGGMPMLKYDADLEELSKCWAARCEDEYSECFLTPFIPETSMSVSQIQLDRGEQPSNILWIKVINYWLGNTKYLSVETLNSLPAGEKGENLRNYAQLMSDRILSIGCAWSIKDEFLTCICTYGPRGPLQGEPIYRTGRPCSLCPFSYACNYEKPFEKLCKELPQTTTEPEETPPSPPPTPPRRNYEIMRSQYLPPSLRFERVQSQRMTKEGLSEIEYEPQRETSNFDLVPEYLPQQEPGDPPRVDSRPPLYFIEAEDPASPPLLPPVPSDYPRPVTPISPPPVLPQPPDTSNMIPPPPPLPHFPQQPCQNDREQLQDTFTTTYISPQTMPEIPNTPRVPIITVPPNVPLRKDNMSSRLSRSRKHHKRSGAGKICLTNVMIYVAVLIAFYDT